MLNIRGYSSNAIDKLQRLSQKTIYNLFTSKSKKFQTYLRIFFIILPLLTTIMPFLLAYQHHLFDYSNDEIEWGFELNPDGNASLCTYFQIQQIEYTDKLIVHIDYSIRQFGPSNQFRLIPINDNNTQLENEIRGSFAFSSDIHFYHKYIIATNQSKVSSELFQRNISLEVVSIQSYDLYRFDKEDSIKSNSLGLYPFDSYLMRIRIYGLSIIDEKWLDDYKGTMEYRNKGGADWEYKFFNFYYPNDFDNIDLLIGFRRSSTSMFFVIIPVILGYYALLIGSFRTDTKEKAGEMIIGYSVGLLFAYSSFISFLPILISYLILGQLIAAFFYLFTAWIEKELNEYARRKKKNLNGILI